MKLPLLDSQLSVICTETIFSTYMNIAMPFYRSIFSNDKLTKVRNSDSAYIMDIHCDCIYAFEIDG